MPRDEEVYRMCESTCVPGVGWGELLARDRYCDKMGMESFTVKEGRITFQPFEPAPDRPPRTTLHPMGKEVAFFDMLRGGGKMGARSMRHAKEWDNRPVARPALIGKTVKGDVLRQSMYRTAREGRRSWTNDENAERSKRGSRPRSSAEGVLYEVENRLRVARDIEDWRQQYLMVTGGSWELSKALAVSSRLVYHTPPPPGPSHPAPLLGKDIPSNLKFPDIQRHTRHRNRQHCTPFGV